MIEKFVLPQQEKLKKLATAHAIWFRIVGGVEIVLSVTLPIFVNVLDSGQPETQVILTAISVSVALLAALRAFYGWQDSWQSFRGQEMQVSSIVAAWELVMIALARQRAENSGGDESRRESGNTGEEGNRRESGNRGGTGNAGDAEGGDAPADIDAEAFRCTKEAVEAAMELFNAGSQSLFDRIHAPVANRVTPSAGG